uniref:Uncharacterized protein n=1 Tax=Anopheles melas TaxID=34690 RepID=A0A182UKS9_9DIPT
MTEQRTTAGDGTRSLGGGGVGEGSRSRRWYCSPPGMVGTGSSRTITLSDDSFFLLSLAPSRTTGTCCCCCCCCCSFSSSSSSSSSSSAADFESIAGVVLVGGSGGGVGGYTFRSAFVSTWPWRGPMYGAGPSVTRRHVPVVVVEDEEELTIVGRRLGTTAAAVAGGATGGVAGGGGVGGRVSFCPVAGGGGVGVGGTVRGEVGVTGDEAGCRRRTGRQWLRAPTTTAAADEKPRLMVVAGGGVVDGRFFGSETAVVKAERCVSVVRRETAGTAAGSAAVGRSGTGGEAAGGVCRVAASLVPLRTGKDGQRWGGRPLPARWAETRFGFKH